MAITEIIRAQLGAEAAERFLALVRPSVGFAVRTDLTTSGSVFGGAPRTTDAFEWPYYDGQPMLLLAQVDCAEAARLLGGDWPLPTDGLLLFFYEDDFRADFSFDDGDDGCRVLHVTTGPEATAAEGSGVVIPALPLEASALPSVPGLMDDEAFEAVGRDVMAQISLADALVEALPVPRQRLLGWCDTDSPRPKGHRPLLQMEAEAGTAWGEIVNVSFWIRDEDLKAGDLSKVRRSYEVA